MKKIVLWIGVVLVLLVIGGLAVVALNLDKTVKRGVETMGPRMTKTDVKLDGVTLSLLSGGGTLKGLSVGNPEGFKAPLSISVGSTTLAVTPRSLFSDKIVVRKIEVIQPEVTVEISPNGINLSKLLSNIQDAAGRSDTNAAPKPKEEPTGEETRKKFQVDDFLISKAKMRLDTTQLGGNVQELTIGDIHLTGLGAGPDGITAAELTALAIGALEKEAVKLAREKLPDLTKQATAELGKRTGLDTNTVDKINKGIGDLLKKK